MAVKFATWGNHQFINPSTGALASGHKLNTYVAGSSTPVTTYTTSAGDVAQSNPIVLNSGGYPTTGQIWITEGTSIKIIWTDANDVVIKTVDNIPGTNDTSSSQDQWVSGPAPTFISSTSFSLVGDQTATFSEGRRLKITDAGGTKYCTITGSAFGAVTTVTVAGDALASPTTAVSYSLVEATNPSISPDMIYRKAAAVASAATCDIWNTAGDLLHVTGTTTITSLGTAPYAGCQKTIIFDGALTLTHGANLDCPGDVNITTAAGDRAVVRADTTTAHIVMSYVRADTIPVFSGVRSTNYLINGFFGVNQRAPATNADDTYAHDRWYALTQTNTIAVSTLSDVENGLHKMARLTQSQAVAQRMGYAQIIEGINCKHLRGKQVTFRFSRVRISNSQPIRYAVLEWTGSEDAVTSDVVNDWTSTDYTDGAAKFFVDANLTPLGNTSHTPSAATLTDGVSLTVTVSGSMNNLIVFVWTEGTAAQNVTLDLGKAKLEEGGTATTFEVSSVQDDLMLCQRYYETAANLRVQNTNGGAAHDVRVTWQFKVVKRGTPTVTAAVGATENILTTNVTHSGNVAADAIFDTGAVTASAEL